MGHPLDDCRGRLQRARKQVQALEADIRAFLERDPYRAFNDLQLKGPQNDLVWRVHIIEAPDPEWSFRVGEIVGNFRSTLDYLVCSFVREHGVEAVSKQAYPLFDDLEKLKERADYYLVGVPAIPRNLIMNFQPGSGDNRMSEGLSLLGRLSNFDKHQALHVMGSIARAENVMLWIDGVPHPWQAESVRHGPFEDAGEILRFDIAAWPIPENKSAHVDADLTFEVAFGEGGPCAGRPVIDTLLRIQNAVVFVTGHFETWFTPAYRRAWNKGRT